MNVERKPHYLVIAGRPVQVEQRETKLQAARRRYGKAFGVKPLIVGEGPLYWTVERVGRLKAANEEHRLRRKNAEQKTKGDQHERSR